MLSRQPATTALQRWSPGRPRERGPQAGLLLGGALHVSVREQVRSYLEGQLAPGAAFGSARLWVFFHSVLWVQE